MTYDFSKNYNFYMQTTLNRSYTIADFQEHLEKTQRLLIETSALSEMERNELALHLRSLQTIALSFKEGDSKLGVFDSICYTTGWDWENTGIQKTKNALVNLEHMIPRLIALQQNMTNATVKYTEMQESVTFLCRNFQGLIDSNRCLMHKVDNLEAKVQAQSQKIDTLTAQNHEILQMLKSMQNDRLSFVSTQASSFVSYI